MPFLSPKRRVSDAENKLRLLLCLRALGMATSDQLWPFVAGLELMEYLPYCLLLDELKKDGEVAQGRFALEGVPYLTPRGEKTLSLLRDKLTHTDCERIRAAAPAYAAGLNERRQAAAAYRRAEPGRYGAVGTVREGDVPALVLDADTPDEALARAVVRGFRACAPRLLTLLYTLPFEAGGRPLPVLRSQEEAMRAAAEGRPALLGYGGREYAAAVALREGETAYGVLLLLPTREAAQGWADAACGTSESLARQVTELVTGEEDAHEL